MAKKVFRKNGASWGTAKGMWGTVDGTSWLPAKKAWAKSGSSWVQVWPPDMAFSSFVVTETAAQAGITTSLISWAIDTSVPGTVSIQRWDPTIGYVNLATGLAVSGSTTLMLVPSRVTFASGSILFRALFTPTHDATRLTTANDFVTVDVPSITLTVPATTAEVHYTSDTLTWTTSGTIPGTVKLQRKLGSGGTWTDFATGLARSGSGSYVLAPAGPSQAGTWYYRAEFTPTHDPGWQVLSAEDSVAVSYRSKGTASPQLATVVGGYAHQPAFGEEEPEWDSWWFLKTAPVRIDGVSGLDRAQIVSASVTLTGFDGFYVNFDDTLGDTAVTFRHAQNSSATVTMNMTFEYGTHITWQGPVWMLKDASSRTWSQICPLGWTYPTSDMFVSSFSYVWGRGFNRIASDNVSLTITCVDGQILTFNEPRYGPDSTGPYYRDIAGQIMK